MKTTRIVLMAIVMFSMLSACVKTGSEKKKELQGYYEVAIEGSLSKTLKIEGACTHVFATYADYSNQGLPDTKSLTIQGKTDDNQLISILLYFKTLPADGKFHLGIDNVDEVYSGFGQFMPDALNTQNGTFYSTDETHTGTCTVVYDAVNQSVSGTFEFVGQGYSFASAAELAGVNASFSGTFSDVPVNDMTDPNNPAGPCFGTTGNPPGQGGGTGGGNNNGQSSITFKNPAFTPIEISFNGETKEAPVGGSAVFKGNAGISSTCAATTSGKTGTGTQIGLQINWNFDVTFPQSGNMDERLDVPYTYFFLKMQNKSSLGISKVYVNYNLVDQTLDNISIPADGNTYNTGYYKAYTNSNVRGEAANGSYWFWNPLTLNFQNNQSLTVIAN